MENLFFTDKVHVAKKNVVSFLQKELEPIKNDINQANKIPIALLKSLGKHGFFGPLIPQKYRGTQLGIIAHCMITEEISKINVAVSVSRTPCILMGYLLNKFSNEYQKEKYLKQVATGDKICSICVTEEMAGSNVAGIKTTAEKKGNSYVLNGSKRFITNAGLSDYYFIWAISNKTVNPRGGMSVFLVEKDTPGLSNENPYNLMGINGIYNGNLELKNVEVPEENLIGMEGNGFNDLMEVFNIERLTLSSESNGIALAAFKESKNYAKTRIQFDKPIASFQLIKLKIAEMATKLQAARLLTYSAAKLLEMKINVTKEASMAKAYSSKTAFEITSEAVQIHGGNGYTDKHSVERYMRDAKFFMIGGGTTEIQNLIIAREELKNSKKKII
ncbi:MAG: acyl-CoA dehydrogenase family protein [Promethearchaeota archaeon]